MSHRGRREGGRGGELHRRPGAVVDVGVRLCPTCNQTGATCEVDDSAATSGNIQLDPTSRRARTSRAATPTPMCQAAPLECPFTRPAAPGTYELIVYDLATTRSLDGHAHRRGRTVELRVRDRRL